MKSSSQWILGLAVMALLSHPERQPRPLPSGASHGIQAATLLTDRYLADPFVFTHKGYHYVFGTTLDGTPPEFFRTRTFEPGDLEWFPLTLDLDAAPPGVVGIWGFTVFLHTDGNYHGYATLHYGYFKTIVAHFVPADGENWTEEKPIGRWRFEKVLAGDLDRGDYAYESNVVVDEDGTLYFLYDAGHPREAIGVDIHIKAHKMLDPANLDPDFAVRPILSPEGYRSEDRNHPGSSQIVEGTFIQRVQGKYVLLYSVGDYLWPNYKLGVAYSDTLIPKQGATYQKPRFEDPENLWGNSGGQGDEIAYLMQSQSAEWPNFAGNELDGPGIGCLVHTDAGHRLVFHARKRGENERRIWTIPVNVQIGGGRPSNQWMTVGE